ncbi:MAG: deoxyribodipyrimidine photo-lyase, partial [Acinetobacter junii]|nr:deoxyribodipyrimidine photo-lyase [Acinetobacter junii]
MSNTYQLIWFRQDLRVRDQAALWHARQNGPCTAICILSPEQWQRHDDADIKIDFYLRQLLELKTELSKLQIPLLIFTVPLWDDIAEFFVDLAEKLPFENVYANIEFGFNELKRDNEVQQSL